jgi:TrmH family RNA methyltransferase
VRQVQPDVLAKATETVTSQGVATIAAARAVTVENAIERMGPLALVLVGVTDPGNAGTLVRTAEAAGAGAVLFCDGSVDAFSPKCVRAAAGSLFRVEVATGGRAVTVLEQLGTSGVDRFATASGRGTAYHDADLAGRVALVLGSEAHGLPPEIDPYVDSWITIPMAGRAESLNVGVAGAIVSFEAMRQRRAAGAS